MKLAVVKCKGIPAQVFVRLETGFWMAWKKAGPGRPKNSTIAGATRAMRMRMMQEAARRGGYDAKYHPFEIQQFALDGLTKTPEGQELTEQMLHASEVMLPFTMPKLQAIAMQQVPVPPPAAEQILRGASLETLEMLRDALTLACREAADKQGGVAQIEGALAVVGDE